MLYIKLSRQERQLLPPFLVCAQRVIIPVPAITHGIADRAWSPTWTLDVEIEHVLIKPTHGLLLLACALPMCAAIAIGCSLFTIARTKATAASCHKLNFA